MRELSGEVVEQIKKATAGVPARAALEGAAETATAMTARDAMVEAAFLMAAVDGKVTPLEIAQFAEAFETAFGADADVDVDALVKRTAAELARDGWDHRMLAVTTALKGTPLAETAYRLAASVALVDDAIEQTEAAALDALAAALEIGDARRQELMAEVRAELFGD